VIAMKKWHLERKDAMKKQGLYQMNYVSLHFYQHSLSHGFHSFYPMDPYQLHLPSCAIKRQKAYVNYIVVTE
jgi:hypothetical protein